MSHYFAIDPGKSGGLAVISDDSRIVYAIKMPDTEHDLVAELKHILLNFDPRRAALERVSGWAGKNNRAATNAMFNFGQNYGIIKGVLAALDVPYEYVQPAQWQRALGCMSGGDKKVTRAAAQRMFPKHKPTHKTADAMLIAEWLRRRELGVKPSVKRNRLHGHPHHVRFTLNRQASRRLSL